MKRDPAPGPLALVQRFVNTKDVEQDRDDLIKPDDLRDFLVESALVSPKTPITTEDLERGRRIREAIRGLLYHNTGEPLDQAALRELNEAARAMPLTVRFGADATATLEPVPGGIDAALGRILGIVFASMADGSWPRLKACKRDTCRWAFYDYSKNESSRWCSMDVCGSREKAKAYRARKATERA